MAYINTSDEKARILKNEKGKLQEEIKQRSKSVGLRRMEPRHNQDEYQQLNDLEREENHIKELMTEEKEKRIKRQNEERKRKRKSFKENLKLYFAQQERKSREAYEQRRIVFRDGGFDEFEKKMRMSSCRVLLKEIKVEKNDGIFIPEIHNNNHEKTYKIVKIGKKCNDALKINDVVIVEAYCGIEIVSKDDVYRIVTDNDIICIL